MRLKSVFVTALLLMSMPLFAGDEVKLQEHPEVADAVRVFDKWVEQHIAHRNVPGLSIAVVYDQEIAWAEGYGYSDLETKTPATPGTVTASAWPGGVSRTTAAPRRSSPARWSSRPTRKNGPALSRPSAPS